MTLHELQQENAELRQRIRMLEDQLARGTQMRQVSTRVGAESNIRFDTLFQSTVQGVIYWNMDAEVILANQVAEQMAGLSLLQMQGYESMDPRWHLVHEDGSRVTEDRALIKAALRSGKPISDVVLGVFHPDSESYRWLLVHTISEFYASESQPFRVFMTFTDITERKQAQKALQTSQERYHQFIAQSFEGIYRTEFDQPIDISLPVEAQIDAIYENAYMAECNQALAEMYRLPSVESLVNVRLLDAHGGKDNPVNRAAFRKFIENGYKSFADETLEYTADGSPVWFLNNTVGTIENGRLVHLWGTSIDITQRKHAESLVYAQRDLARIIGSVNSSQEAWPLCVEIALRISGMDCGGIYLFDESFKVMELVYWRGLSDEFIQIAMRYPVDAPNVQVLLKGTSIYRDASDTTLNPLYAREGISAVAVVPIHDRGRMVGCINLASHTLPTVPALVRQSLETIAAEIGGIVTYLRTEAALRASEQILRESQAMARLGSWMADVQERIVSISPEAARLVGWQNPDVYPAEALLDVVHPQDRELALSAWRAAMTGAPFDLEVRVLVNGEVRWLRLKARFTTNGEGVMLSAVGSAQDITESKQASEEIQAGNERFNTLFYNAPMHGVVYRFLRNNQGEIIDWELSHINQLGAQSLGQSAESLVGKRASELMGGEVFAPYLALSRQVAADGQARLFETHFATSGQDFVSSVFLVGKDHYANISIDISERKRVEKALAHSERRLKSLIASAMDAIVAVDSHQNVLLFNEAAEKMFGVSSEEVLGKPIDRFIPFHLHPVHHQAIVGLDRETADRILFGKIFSISGIRGDGTEFPGEASVSYVEYEGEKIYTTILRDVTERKQAEMALLAREELYRGLMKSLDSAVVTADVHGRLLYMNDHAARQLNSTPNMMIGKSLGEIFPEPFASSHLARIRQVCQEDRGIITERLIVVQGIPRWYRISVEPIHDAAGSVIYALVNLTDINDLKIAHQELLELNATLEERVRQRTAEAEDLYENAPVGYHSLSAGGIYVMVNQTELKRLGYSREEMIGRPVKDFLTPKSRQVFDETYSALQQHGSLSYELEFVRKDGSVLPVAVSATAVYDAQGKLAMRRSSLFDITERKAAEVALRDSEEALRHANRELERAMRMKDEFLASMSHELRTPLSGILGITEGMQENVYGSLNERQLKALINIENSGRHLLDLINDVLDIAKIEAGKIELQIDSFALKDICQASLQLIKGMALKKNHKVNFSLSPSEIYMRGDGRRIKQVIVNLLSNAVKYTLPGGSVGLEVKGDSLEKVIYLSVWDTGIGIKPEDMDKLFQPFVQIDSSLARQNAGSGLGLTLAQNLVDLHGGSINVESVYGQGSRFTISLPWVKDEKLPSNNAQKEAAAVGPGSLEALHQDIDSKGTGLVMLVDDNEVNVETISDFLKARHFEVISMYDAWSFIEQLPKVRPDLVLMDIQMPGMDGLEAIRQVRARADTTIASVPIIAITALSMPGDREKCLQAGANEYLSKPVRLNQLVDIIQSLLVSMTI